MKPILTPLIFFVIALLSTTQPGRAQIAEFTTELSEEHTTQLFDLLGITVAELPIKMDEGSYFVDLILDEYKNGELIRTEQFYSEENISDLRNSGIVGYLPKADTTGSTINIYTNRQSDTLEVFKAKYGLASWKRELTMDPNEDYHWKTFLDKEIAPETKTPVLSLFTIWDQKAGNGVIRRACLPNLPPEELGKILSHYYVFSIKLMPQLP